jgi:hypothetical protein
MPAAAGTAAAKRKALGGTGSGILSGSSSIVINNRVERNR